MRVSSLMQGRRGWSGTIGIKRIEVLGIRASLVERSALGQLCGLYSFVQNVPFAVSLAHPATFSDPHSS